MAIVFSTVFLQYFGLSFLNAQDEGGAKLSLALASGNSRAVR
jgi:hypothetical protein